ncbi:MAG: AbrB/MazE/SpoVT family DNA-binding domain-containing protein [Pseudolysinimonas sp.]|jgi:AbrB family looped-hinge helix DNA binding protein|uniref:AbrB/MazE/SpoVT family DNA-binding domain-containing protein n=1 Tax=Pseudolysinimonas sp. TaxID=2680009 RepID=UPI003C7566EC
MNVTIDKAGRIVVPKPVRDALGLRAGDELDLTTDGSGIQLTARGRTARLVMRDGRLVATSDTVITDEDVFRLIDAFRR